MRNVRYFVVALLVTCFAVTGCKGNSAGAGSVLEGCRVVNVVDGDTIDLTNRSVRYVGIDTPEVRKRRAGGWEYAPEPYALEAKRYNDELVGGRKVDLEFDVQKEDKHGRLLAYVYVGGKMVNAELLRQGYAIVRIFPPNIRYLDTLIDAQKEAILNKRGLWKDCETILPVEAHAHVGQVCRVRGMVLNAYRTPVAVFLNFGNTREDFTVVIFNSNISLFEKAGILLPGYYKGKYIEVTGKIKEREGPQIVADHPWQIATFEAQ